MPGSELIGFIMFFIVNVLACFLHMVLRFIAIFSQSSETATPDQMSTTAQALDVVRSVIEGFFPTVTLKQALFNIRLHSNPDCVSAINTIMVTNLSSDETWTSIRQPGIGFELVLFSAQTVAWWMILTCIESRIKIGQFFHYLFNQMKQKTIHRKKSQANRGHSNISLEWDDSV